MHVGRASHGEAATGFALEARPQRTAALQQSQMGSNKLGVLAATVTDPGSHWEEADPRLERASVGPADPPANLVTGRRNRLGQ